MHVVTMASWIGMVEPRLLNSALHQLQPERAVGGEPVRDGVIAEHVTVAVPGDQFADADDDADDQDPAPADLSRGPPVMMGYGRLGSLSFCAPRVGGRLWFHILAGRRDHCWAGRTVPVAGGGFADMAGYAQPSRNLLGSGAPDR